MDWGKNGGIWTKALHYAHFVSLKPIKPLTTHFKMWVLLGEKMHFLKSLNITPQKNFFVKKMIKIGGTIVIWYK